MKIVVKNIFRDRVEASGVKKFICNELNITPQWFAKLLKSSELEDSTIVRVGLIINHDFSIDFPEIIKNKIYTLEQCQQELNKVLKLHIELMKEHKLLLKKINSTA